MTDLFTPKIRKEFVKSAPELKKYVATTEFQLIPSFEPPFERLISAIIYQQLSGKAAGTIYNRFLDLIGELTPKNILKFSDDQLKNVGLSRQKLSYVKNVAHAFQPGGFLEKFNTASDLEGFSGNEIIDEFTKIKGVGEWTVQMYLIFGLGFLDIFPSHDLGVRKGIQLMYNRDETPTPGVAKKMTKHWRYPTLGAILSWRVLDNE